MFGPGLLRQRPTQQINVNDKELIYSTAKQTLAIETEVLRNLTASLNDAFVDAVLELNNSEGRVVVTGVGKSALIGQKIVSTFNSTGTPALFMHAADAIHGDMGMIGKEDVVLCMSKSGQTAEIKVLVPFLKNFGNPLIAMTSSPESYLALHANHVLHIPISQEAEPNNLAPTASTTAQMAMGDALATSLMAIKGFSTEDFARFHPGGSLGKYLYLTVEELYLQNEKPLVLSDSNIRTVILEMTSKRLGMTAVVAANDKLIGVITDGDLRRMLNQNTDVSKLCAEDIMSKNPRTIVHSELAVRSLEMMRQYSITQLPVTRDGVYVGVIHLHDLIREGLV